MNPKYYKVYFDFNELNDGIIQSFYNYLFSVSNSFAFRLPKGYTSEKEYFEYVDRINVLINKNKLSIVRKIKTNSYFDNRYGGGQFYIYVGKLNNCDKQFIINNSNIYYWSKPSFPEDLCLLNNNRIVMSVCSHEEYSCLYLTKEQIVQLSTTTNFDFQQSFIKRISSLEIPELDCNTGDGSLSHR